MNTIFHLGVPYSIPISADQHVEFPLNSNGEIVDLGGFPIYSLAFTEVP